VVVPIFHNRQSQIENSKLQRLSLIFHLSDCSDLRVKLVNIPDMVQKQMGIFKNGTFQVFDFSRDSSKLLILAETRTISLLRFFRLVLSSIRYRVPDNPTCSAV